MLASLLALCWVLRIVLYKKMLQSELLPEEGGAQMNLLSLIK